MAAGGNFPMTPRQGTYLIGIVNFIGSVTAVAPIKLYGRKTCLIAGHASMGACLILIGIFQIGGQGMAVLILMLCFLMAFQNSQGPIAWIYTSEVVVDAAMGAVVLALMSTIFLIACITGTLMTALTPQGTFFFFGVSAFLGMIYLIIYMKETKGLTDREKKSLFKPKHLSPVKAVKDTENTYTPKTADESITEWMGNNKPFNYLSNYFIWTI